MCNGLADGQGVGHCPEGRSRYRKDLYCLVSKMMLGNDPKTTVRFRFRVSSRT
jgi:hypothetical protein